MNINEIKVGYLVGRLCLCCFILILATPSHSPCCTPTLSAHSSTNLICLSDISSPCFSPPGCPWLIPYGRSCIVCSCSFSPLALPKPLLVPFLLLLVPIALFQPLPQSIRRLLLFQRLPQSIRRPLLLQCLLKSTMVSVLGTLL